MMLHRHFDDKEEPKPAQATENGTIAEGADIVSTPAKPAAQTEKPKRSTRKKATEQK